MINEDGLVLQRFDKYESTTMEFPITSHNLEAISLMSGIPLASLSEIVDDHIVRGTE